MGSFAGVNIDAQNLEQAVNLAEQKKILSQQSDLQMFNNDVKIEKPKFDLSNNFFVSKKPYLVVQDFIVFVSKKDKRGNPIGQEQHQYPNQKNTVVFLPLGEIGDQVEMQNQYDIALQQGKLKELPIVTVESLVDKQSGFCGSLTQSQSMLMVYRPPCISVSRGEMLKGVIVLGTFTSYDDSGYKINKPVLSSNEFKVIENNKKSTTIDNSKEKNQNKLIIMVIGAFVLGYLLSND